MGKQEETPKRFWLEPPLIIRSSIANIMSFTFSNESLKDDLFTLGGHPPGSTAL